jgi:hypothetical protein
LTSLVKNNIANHHIFVSSVLTSQSQAVLLYDDPTDSVKAFVPSVDADGKLKYSPYTITNENFISDSVSAL